MLMIPEALMKCVVAKAAIIATTMIAIRIDRVISTPPDFVASLVYS